MRLLVITPPLHQKTPGAAELDMFGMIDVLKSLGHEVSLYVLDAPHYDPGMLKEIGIRHQVSVRSFLPNGSLLVWLKDAIQDPALLDRAAYGFHLMAKDISFQSYLREFNPDVVMSFCSYSWPLFRTIKSFGARLIFRAHNFEPTFYLEALDTLPKWYPSTWIRVLAKYMGERRAVMRSDIVGSIPFEQIRLFEKWKPGLVFRLPLTFLSQIIKPPRMPLSKPVLDVFYLGASYNVSFHRRGVELLIEKIIPRVRELAPGKFRFHICGSKLPERLRAQCNGDDLIYEGYVPDLALFLEGMDIGAFPIFSGKSMKGKVFEPLVRSFPIVIPTLGLGGYTMESGKEVLIADTPEAFAESIVSLQDPELRKKLSLGAHAFSEREFSPTHIAEILTTLISKPI